MRTPGVSLSFAVVASVEFGATLVLSESGAPPGGGVARLKASLLGVLTLTVKFELDSVAVFFVLRHRKINI